MWRNTMTKKLTPADIVAQVQELKANIETFNLYADVLISGVDNIHKVYPPPNVSEKIVEEFFNGISNVNTLMKDTVNPKLTRIAGEFNR
jgi:hypothetical protein